MQGWNVPRVASALHGLELVAPYDHSFGGGDVPRRRPRLKVVRRLGTVLPGLTRKVVKRKPYPPGAHGPARSRRRKSNYGEQLEEKQKVRFHYGITETQLRRDLALAARQPGPTGRNLFALLERRLDNIIFRLGWAPTIPAARQLVAHRHVLVNDGRVNRAGYRVEVGDTVALSRRGRQLSSVAEAIEQAPHRGRPSYLALDPEDRFVGRVVKNPARTDVPFPVDDAAIVEFYAR
jgi:small subunit ribosomal protein S4